MSIAAPLSNAATPTPSPRPSLNLPSRTSLNLQPSSRRNSNSSSASMINGATTTTTSTSSSSTPIPTSQTRKNRAALRQFYNLSSSEEAAQQKKASEASDPTSTSTSTSETKSLDTTTSDPLSALDDTPNFSASDFVSQTLSSSSAQDLLSLLSSITSSALSLEGDKKALVYDNYTTLLAATSTISGLLGKKEGARESLVEVKAGSLLEVGVGGVEKLVGEIVGARGGGSRPRKEREGDAETEGKDGRDREEQRRIVQWVLAAPSRLKTLKKEGKDGEAEHDWKEISMALDKWDGVEGVRDVRERCERVMRGEEIL